MGREADERKYWVGFNQVKFVGPARLQRVQAAFGGLETAWHASASALRQVLDDRAAESLISTRSEIDLDRLMERYAGLGVSVVTIADSAYPALLKEISGAPTVLYVRGRMTEADARAVGVVGTRRVTAYGREMTRQIAGGLASAGVTVVSGLARGVDGVAHAAAIQAGGRTIAVLGSGPDVIYPAEHKRLAAEVIENGAIVSELPPGRPPDAPNFPARNRIVSGLSLGVVVIEAPEKSGALITADFAADQSREVFALPGNVMSESSFGTNRLLREGARIVRDAADVLEDLGLAPYSETEPRQTALPMSEDERRIFAVINREPQHLDDVAIRAHVDATAASACLMMLELKGAVRNTGAQHYVRS